MITIALQCHNFQHRLCWMLSSLVQQAFPNEVSVIVDHMNGNGNPTTEKVCQLFAGRLNILRFGWDDISQFQYRGVIRNRQMKACQTKWLMFGDCDMVYHPGYFSSLIGYLEEKHAKATYMLSSGRISNPKELTNALVSGSDARIPMEILGAWQKANELPKIEKSNVGAGFCQLINMQDCPHDGYYVDPSKNKDWSWSRRGSNPKSDMQFRRRIHDRGGGRQPLPRWFTESAIHLNHNRDPEAGCHITEQR